MTQSAATNRPTYPHVTAVVNLKGGVGKTTLCVNLAYGMAYFEGTRVLLIDLDPQANATQYLIPQQSYRDSYLSTPPKKSSAFELFQAYETANQSLTGVTAPADPDQYLQRVYRSSKGYLDVLASKLQLSLLAFQGGHVQKNDQIRWFVESVGDRYDHVLIDCPPTVSRMLISGFEAAEYVLVPIKPDYLSSIGLPLLQHVITKTYEKDIARRPTWMTQLRLLGLVFTLYDQRLNMTMETEVEIRRQAEQMGTDLFASKISNSTRYSWSSQQSLPVFRSEPRSRYAEEVRKLVVEFLGKFESKRGRS